MACTFNVVLYALFTLSPAAARQIRPRVVGGVQDDNHEFPFAVMIQSSKSFIRTCSGSAIAPTWVLTAAHCCVEGYTSGSRVKYGDTTIPSNETKFFANIISGTIHPANMRNYGPIMYSDIGLLKTEKISNIPFPKLSAVDYAAFMGMPVKYAGFGRTKLLLQGEGPPKKLDKKLDFEPPFLMGEAVVISCKQDDVLGLGGPNICIAPRCGPRQQPYLGDSGGPLIYNGRIIGVGSFLLNIDKPLTAYAPVSPFLDWIYETMRSS